MGIDANNGAKPGDSAPVIPDHELLCVIGQGSYGKVWLARNSLGVFRAIKLVYRSAFDNQKPFDREWAGIKAFEPISRSHEGFMDILQVSINREAGFFYYVMELGDDAVQGQNIDPAQYRPKTLAGEIAERQRLPYQECLEMGLALSLALGEVHKHGLVHRDVKPSNIIYVNGVPKLADIGLVAPASEARSYVGTQGFIPPEGPGTPQADVYSLGKVIYEASTGKDRQDFPELPTQLGTMVREDRFLELNEVILRACHNDFKARYQTAWDLHAHLLVLANGKSVKRLNVLERRLARLRSAAGVALAVLVALGAVGYHFWRQWRTGVRAQIDLAVAAANRAVDSGRLFDALASDVAALELAKPGSDLDADLRLKIGSILTQTPKLTLFQMEKKPLKFIHWSRDGTKVLIAQERGEAVLLDASTGQIVGAPFDSHKFLASAALSPDGTLLVTTSESRPYCILWNVAEHKELLKLRHDDKVMYVTFSRDGNHIATCCRDKIARIWNSRTGALERTLLGHTDLVMYCEFSHDGRLLATASRDGTARVWSVADEKMVVGPLPHNGWVATVDFSPDDSMLVTASGDKHTRVWDLTKNGAKFPVEISHRKPASSASFSPDGRLILTTSYDGMVELWRASDLQRVNANSSLNQANGVSFGEFSPDGLSIAVGGADGSVRIWNFAAIAVPPLNLDRVYCANGSRFVTVVNGFVAVHDAATETVISRQIPATALERFPTISEDGNFIVTLSTNAAEGKSALRTVQVWNAAKGTTVAPAIRIDTPVGDLALSRDGTRLATVDGRFVQAWDMLRGAPLARSALHSNTVTAIAFNPRGDRIASAGGKLVFVWNPTNEALVCPPLAHEAPVDFLLFHDTESKLVTCCADKSLAAFYGEIWNSDTGVSLRRLNHTDGVLTAAFDRKGERLVTGGEDHFAFVWDFHAGRRLTGELAHREQVKSTVFSDDGKWLVSLSADQTVWVWDSWTGDSLSFPIRVHKDDSRVGFISGRKAIFATDEQGHSRVWDLPVNRNPVPILRKLAKVVSGGTPDDYKPLPPTSEAPILAAWQSLKASNPEYFSVSPAEVRSWHEFMAADCKSNKLWRAELFHLKVLLAANPADTSLLDRISEASAALEKQTSAAK